LAPLWAALVLDVPGNTVRIEVEFSEVEEFEADGDVVVVTVEPEGPTTTLGLEVDGDDDADEGFVKKIWERESGVWFPFPPWTT
jgi:hypothetical protein